MIIAGSSKIKKLNKRNSKVSTKKNIKNKKNAGMMTVSEARKILEE